MLAFRLRHAVEVFGRPVIGKGVYVGIVVLIESRIGSEEVLVADDGIGAVGGQHTVGKQQLVLGVSILDEVVIRIFVEVPCVGVCAGTVELHGEVVYVFEEVLVETVVGNGMEGA